MKIKTSARFTAPVLLCAALAVTAANPAWAQDPVPSEESLEDAFKPQRHYSPYARRNYPTRVFWGDTHLHTNLSMDAGAFGARLSPRDAYRFARGEEVVSSTEADRETVPAAGLSGGSRSFRQHGLFPAAALR
jgi:hypothetical protein